MNTQIINFLSQIKIGSLSYKEHVFVKYNKVHLKILRSLYQEGLIVSYNIIKKEDNIVYTFVHIRSYHNKFLLNNLKIVSTPSKTVYLNYEEISKLATKKKTFFFSTTKGICTDSECKRFKLGGVLYFVC